MKVFLSYSLFDKIVAKDISIRLEKEGHSILHPIKVKEGDNYITKINDELENAEAFIIVLSNSAKESTRVQREISSIVFGELSKRNRIVIPVIIDNVELPQYLANYLYVDLTVDFENGIDRIVQSLANIRVQSYIQNKTEKRLHYKIITELSNKLKDGRLTLVVGAGCSNGAGVPKWDELLARLLESMLKKMNSDDSNSFSEVLSHEFQKRYNPTPLIIGKYLESYFGENFLIELRNALYKNNPITCETIDAIVNLSRPQRVGKSLDSIITFNYDSLIEENLERNKIEHKVIYKEGVRNTPQEIPIYHVHGYLPRIGEFTEDNGIVFSEESYHSQFIDPFNWSNLILLNKLSQNTCLFIGFSMTDPNLRRLLDVANRKNPSKSLNHYIINPIPNMSRPGDIIDEFAMILEEMDLVELGLNVIWIENFKEIHEILNEVCK